MTAWVDLEPGTLRKARERQGLSQEAAARAIPVATRTWRRWEASDRLPSAAARGVAQLLDVVVPSDLGEAPRDEVIEELRGLRQDVQAISDTLAEWARRASAGRGDALDAAERAAADLAAASRPVRPARAREGNG